MSGAVASTTPHGSTIIERPPERIPGACSPIWLAATTNACPSIARARSRTSQWSRVVANVNAAGHGDDLGALTARIRYSSGKRTS